ncbi:peptidoglycan-binding domain-containing protein [Streptomyces sp. H39-S7]|uniref:peptidoglycan-binding domain-containing protein n=1 Tax=Streptomyces sp. H39-S7 TaxID=3004357 RepID=UPI0022AEF164|nr:peptidoglycan-binding domain-containing protein [Streptomyces sp. H39-S7]MCZ4119842.1 peptidoglycan-binding domain-containing protein [Streptomyces sp. H39-S7]
MVRPYLSHPRHAEAPSAPVAPEPLAVPSPQTQDPAPALAAGGPDSAGTARAHPRRRRTARAKARRGRTTAVWLSVTAAGCFLWWVLPAAPPESRSTVAGPPSTHTTPADGATDHASAPAAPTSAPPLTGPASSGPTTPAGRRTQAPQGPPPTTASVPPSTGAAGAGAPGSGAPTRGHARNPATGGSRELGPGDRGANVARLQDLLYDHGKTYVSSTGVYDSDTERAVRDIQQEYGITADRSGSYGSATRAALDPTGTGNG